MKVPALFTGGNIIVAIISAVSGLLYARWIEADVLGYFLKFQILTNYLVFGLIVVTGGYTRDFPYYLGKGDKKKALEIVSVCKFWVSVIFYVGTLVFLTLGVVAFLKGDYRTLYGWLVQIPILLSMTFGVFYSSLYRTNKDFLKLNRNNLFKAFSGTIALPLVYFFSYNGLVLRAGFQRTVEYLAMLYNSPFKINAKYDSKILIDVAKVSVPLQIPVLLNKHLIATSLSFFILSQLGETELGIYGMAFTLNSFLLIISSSINQIYSVKLTMYYGKTESLKETLKYIAKPTLGFLGLAIIILIIFNYSIGHFVSLIIPNYIDSVKPLQILSLELLIAFLTLPFGVFSSGLMHKNRLLMALTNVVAVTLYLFLSKTSVINAVTAIIVGKFSMVLVGYLLIIVGYRRNKT